LLLPFGFLIGVAILLLAPDVLLVLPGAGSPFAAVLASPLLAVPLLLALASRRRLRRDIAAGRRASRSVFALLRVLPISVPMILLVWLELTGWTDLADRWGGRCMTATMSLLVLPLVLMEVSRLVAETPTRDLLDQLGHGAGALPLGRRLGMVVFAVTPWMVFAALGDASTWFPQLTAFLVVTSVGRSLCAIGAGLLLAALLPLAFRLSMRLSRKLPPALAAPLGDTVEALGFSRRSLRVMDTDRRMANALLLGVLPWPRYLVLTDALLGMLDLFALRGVVAHEVGHARGGHLMLFLGTAMVVLPLGLCVAQQADLLDSEPTRQAVVAVALLAALVFVVHRVAHRFEHEADVLSAVALGGAGPCIRALQCAGQFNEHGAGRASFLHPAEHKRIETLLAWDADPGFRQRFARRGRRLRVAVASVTAIVVAAAVWAWFDAWPAERALLHFHLGDFARARAESQAAAGKVRSGMWHGWQLFGEEVEAAIAMVGTELPDGDDGRRLVELSWQRGLELLSKDEAAAARPYLSLATWNGGTPLQRCLDRYCIAVVEGDRAEEEVLRAHIRRIGYPPQLASVFGP
jgi:hypothetical protein